MQAVVTAAVEEQGLVVGELVVLDVADVKGVIAGRVDIAVDNSSFTAPLVATAGALARAVGTDCQVVLLGSIASPKYVDVLLDVFGDRLQFPLEFVGRGDMSRGGLLLRQATAGVELDYGPVRGAVRTGVRPPKLPPLARQPAAPKAPRGRP